jgi:hypothetical protein
MSIPIVDDQGEIVGWTDNAPEICGITLRHAEAERLLRSAVRCVYGTITNRGDAMRAGAPSDWSEPWRCLMLCKDDAPLPHIFDTTSRKEIVKRRRLHDVIGEGAKT